MNKILSIKNLQPLRFSIYHIFILVSLIHSQSQGQVSYGGTPASFNQFKNATIRPPVIEMLPVNNFDLQCKESQESNLYKKQKFAKGFNVDISPENAGVWNIIDGMKIWRIVIRSIGAYSLNIIFDRFVLPTGASVFIYTPDHQILRGAFNANNEQSSGILPIYPLPGDEIIVEYNEPINVSTRGELHISQVNHGYKNIIGSRPLGEAGNCNMDVLCKEAVSLSKEKQAVVQLVIAGTDLCTGTLVNNTKRDKAPYLITAGHCIQSTSDAQKTVFSFNYESPSCGKEESVNGFGDQSMTGAILRARSDSLDFALVELEMLPPPEYRPYYSGWDHSKTISASTKAIHHPKGDVKKVSVDLDAPGIGTYNTSTGVTNSYWWIKKWDVGTTEPGSSGGPLFNNSNLFIGTLQGGLATCQSSVDDYFVMMAYQWNYSSSITHQLKRWLDPTNTGVSTIEAMDPYAISATCDQFSDVIPDEEYKLTKLVSGRGYVTGHNSLKIAKYAQEFDKSNVTTLTAFSVGLAKAITTSSDTSSNITFRIYSFNDKTGLPGNILKSIKMPIKLLKSKSMNFIPLDQPITVMGKYFLGYDINYTNTGDTIAIYNSASRTNPNQNHAFCFNEGRWEPFYWIPAINLRTSLLIDTYGCETTYASIDPVSTNSANGQFQIYYPTDSSQNLLYLVNLGKEEFGRVIFYDLTGRKLSEEQRMLTNSPMALDYGHLVSSVILIAIETLTHKEVLKARFIRNR